jgi:hypothetical protein
MVNPYFELHKEFKAAGARILMSSGQACVLFGIAAFSKDGDWIVEETESSCQIVLEVLERKKAFYRLGMPLDVRYLRGGWTSHFEYITSDEYRMRVDFCSRPPRIETIQEIWQNFGTKNSIDVIDVENLIRLKQTRRVRDYHIIGTLAQVMGFQQGQPSIALNYLQDYSLLKNAVQLWPMEALECDRPAVRLLRAGGLRSDVIAALAIEQDEKIQADEFRIKALSLRSKTLQQKFISLKKEWLQSDASLLRQHDDLLKAAQPILEAE